MLHRKGNRVDVEALRDRIPLRQIAGKGPQMGSHRYRKVATVEVVSWLSWMFLGYMEIYRRKKSVRGGMRGPRGWGHAQGGRARLPASSLP